MKLRLSALALGTTLLVGCASSGTDQQGRSDPLEGFNRTMYNFNFNVLDPYIVRPVAVAWRDYVPQPARNGLSNFTGNLEEPAVMVNYFLQGDPYQGMVHFTRFFLNTILGMGGFIDVAGMANPKLQRTEPHRFGSTLGHYGVGYGPYVQLPFYGSFTLRDDGGDMADGLYPVLWLTGRCPWVNGRLKVSKPVRNCWIPTACCVSRPTHTLWCAKRTSSVMISSPMAANSNRRKTRTRKRFRMS